MSLEDAAREAARVWPRDTAIVMVAIMGCESSWRGDARGDPVSIFPPDLQAEVADYACDGFTSFGLGQVNTYYNSGRLRAATGSPLPCIWAGWLYDPAHNIDMCADILSRLGYGAWSCYRNGDYLTHLPAATTAVDAALGGAPPPPPPPPPIVVPGEAVAAAAEILGFWDPGLAVVMTAIAGALDGWDPNHREDPLSQYTPEQQAVLVMFACEGYFVYGMFPFHLISGGEILIYYGGSAVPCVQAAWLRVLRNNLRLATRVTNQFGFGYWQSFYDGSYAAFLPVARAAVLEALGLPPTAALPPPPPAPPIPLVDLFTDLFVLDSIEPLVDLNSIMTVPQVIAPPGQEHLYTL